VESQLVATIRRAVERKALLRTGGKDKTVVDARIREIFDETRGNPSADKGSGAEKGAVLAAISKHHTGIAGAEDPVGPDLPI